MHAAFTAGHTLRQPAAVQAVMATAAQALVRTLATTLETITELYEVRMKPEIRAAVEKKLPPDHAPFDFRRPCAFV